MTDDSLQNAARALDDALERGDRDAVVSCFRPDCHVELLGVRLAGHDGVRRWVDWLFGHIDALRLEPAFATTDGPNHVEEVVAVCTLADGLAMRSHQVRVLSFDGDRVASMRLYFNPLDFAAAEGRVAEFAEPMVSGLLRRGLEPYERLDPDSF